MGVDGGGVAGYVDVRNVWIGRCKCLHVSAGGIGWRTDLLRGRGGGEGCA